MSVSTLALDPEPQDGSGSGSCAETHEAHDRHALRLVQGELGGQVIITTGHESGDDDDKAEVSDQLVKLASRSDFDTWLSRASSAGSCSRPIRLTGKLQHIDTQTGELLGSEDVPDGDLYTACGDRRASVCPSCAETYRKDAYQLVRAGLAGGKGVPESVATHPALFVTFTAPSFGLVHSPRTTPGGRRQVCHPRRKPQLCRHGQDLRCHQTHSEDEACVGRPLCPDCYDYAGAVVWNAHASELWRRTTMKLRRYVEKIARAHGMQVKVNFGKVAEYQTRGLVHFHALIRLDGYNPDNPEAYLPPPPAVTRAHLEDAITDAVETTGFATLPHPDKPEGWDIAWGRHDIQTVATTSAGEITDTQVAGYIAKYATKSTEAVGVVSARITPFNIDSYGDDTHAGRLIRAAYELGSYDDLPDSLWALRRWAHMLGFRGHFFTKSRRYSTTFKALRNARTDYRRRQARIRARDHQDAEEETTLVVGLLSYAGSGWRTSADARLAQTAAARARERQHIAQEELACSN